METLEVLPSPLNERVANAVLTSACVPSKPISDLLSSVQLSGSELQSKGNAIRTLALLAAVYRSDSKNGGSWNEL